MGVRCVVDIHLWDRARWRGAAYFDYGPQVPPVLALMFEDRDAAQKIFVRWRERFGTVDKDETISSNCKEIALLPIAITGLSHESGREHNKLIHLSSSKILISTYDH